MQNRRRFYFILFSVLAGVSLGLGIYNLTGNVLAGIHIGASTFWGGCATASIIIGWDK